MSELKKMTQEQLIEVVNNQQLTINKAMAVIKQNKATLENAEVKNKSLLREIGMLRTMAPVNTAPKSIDEIAFPGMEIVENKDYGKR